MPKPHFSDDEIRAVLREAQQGTKVQELCRKHGISDATFYSWRAKYADLDRSHERRVKQLEEENQRLRSIVADLTLRNQALKRVVSKKW